MEHALTLAGIWSSLHGDQRQDGHECGASLSGHCQVSTELGRERAGQSGAIWDPVGPGPSPSPRAHLQPAFGGRGTGARLSSPPTAQPTSPSSSRELKYRARRQADEPSFQIRDYVESQKKRPVNPKGLRGSSRGPRGCSRPPPTPPDLASSERLNQRGESLGTHCTAPPDSCPSPNSWSFPASAGEGKIFIFHFNDT